MVRGDQLSRASLAERVAAVGQNTLNANVWTS